MSRVSPAPGPVSAAVGLSTFRRVLPSILPPHTSPQWPNLESEELYESNSRVTPYELFCVWSTLSRIITYIRPPVAPNPDDGSRETSERLPCTIPLLHRATQYSPDLSSRPRRWRTVHWNHTTSKDTRSKSSGPFSFVPVPHTTLDWSWGPSPRPKPIVPLLPILTFRTDIPFRRPILGSDSLSTVPRNLTYPPNTFSSSKTTSICPHPVRFRTRDESPQTRPLIILVSLETIWNLRLFPSFS